jgi:aminobenzoyl-glutamate utilization protein B
VRIPLVHPEHKDLRIRTRSGITAHRLVSIHEGMALHRRLAPQYAMLRNRLAAAVAAALLTTTLTLLAQSDTRLDTLKKQAAADVDARSVFTQQMVDSIFSFSELGFEEVETQRYVTGILEREGFKVERGVANIPTSWVARWGSGKPVIALGTDIDGVPQTNQTPGVVTRRELVPGGPGHGEGHNGGQAVIVTAALAVKRLMEREKIPGTLVLWPGVAEELLGSKAYFVRAGVFKDVDAVLYTHVGSTMGVRWGDMGSSGLVSVEYTFNGESAHAARAPWLGRSALDAVELMDIGWNFRREHLRLAQRSHYVISNGGDQPNVVPPKASVWYYFRENDYDHIKDMWKIGDTMAQGAALMTNTTVESRSSVRRGRGTATARSRKRCTRTSSRWECRSGATPTRRLRGHCRKPSARRNVDW